MSREYPLGAVFTVHRQIMWQVVGEAPGREDNAFLGVLKVMNASYLEKIVCIIIALSVNVFVRTLPKLLGFARVVWKKRKTERPPSFLAVEADACWLKVSQPNPTTSHQ